MDLARKEGRCRRFGAPGFDALEQMFPCVSFVEPDQIDVYDLGQQTLGLAFADPHRHEEALVPDRILRERRGPLGCRELRGCESIGDRP